MAKEIIQVDNKMKDFHGIPLIGTFKVKSNSLSGEFILFMEFKVSIFWFKDDLLEYY